VTNLPPDSALGMTISDGWTIGDYLFADVFQAITGQPHPARPKPEADEPALPAAIERVLAERAKRQREERL
jgi:hypothetical protein